jgi:hypothetical protein
LELSPLFIKKGDNSTKREITPILKKREITPI